MDVVSDSAFDQLLADKDGLILVDFFADWCAPCRALSPVLETLEASYPDVSFIKVDTERSKRVASAFGVRSLPTVLLLRAQAGSAEVVSVTLGAKPQSYWIKLLDQATKPKPKLLERLFGRG